MSLGNFWAALTWPTRSSISAWWAMVNQRDRSPVPAAATVADVATGAAIIAAHYRPDPVNGLLDYSEDPRRVQYHLDRGTLGELPALDCDDLAYWAAASLREIASPCHVLVLTDLTGRYSHAVCEAWVDGQHWVIDTNGLHSMSGWPSVSALFQSIYPGARYGGEYRAANPFSDPGRV